ncbi:DUF4221 family protein [Anditalea andensis]|uniref:Uncharacterized protein n=1 Tax=Anditalea andensis TaxID=1048983 RepID=A0A074LD05_9BACT|nr:DUF4221 family protein [Anditalea andensis]KEO71647.1 hypothetical protein EL17_23605 [Anditalea andensis]
MKKLSYLFIAFVFWNCSTEIKKIEIETVGSLEIPLAQTISPSRMRFQYFESDTGEYLAFMNKVSSSIEIYDLNSRKSVKSIQLQSEGPNGVGVHNGFHILSKDSLLLASIPPKVLLLDFEGNKLGTFPVEDKDNKVNYLASNNKIPFLFSGNEIFGTQPFFDDFFYMKAEKIPSYKHIYKFQLSSATPEVEWLPVSHPSDIWNDGKKTEDFSWTDRQDSIIVSPSTDHRLWIISKKQGELLAYKNVKSAFVNKFQIINKLPEGEKGIIDNLASDQYGIIQYDPYRDVFYRFFSPGVDWEDYNIGHRDLFSYRPKTGITVLDKNLDVIGEYVFEDFYIEPSNYFVGKKGLYISTNHPLSEGFDENFMKYDIIQFVKPGHQN